jgi:hypothetical protein
MKWFTAALAAALIVAAPVPSPALAQPSKEALKAQFKAREPELHKLKQQERVVRRSRGMSRPFLPAPADEQVTRLVSDENRDRREL